MPFPYETWQALKTLVKVCHQFFLEFLEVVFACYKFRSYIIDSKVTAHTDHAAIK
mgnify:CR=1 FL=1